MKGRVLMIAAILMLLAGCSRQERDGITVQAEIDWVDFVMLNGHSYTGLYNSIIADPANVTEEEAGRTAFKVADVVSNPDYTIKDGDAAFLPIGTVLYKVKGYTADQLIAAKNKDRIGGYSLYAENEFVKTVQLHYGDIPKDKTVRIELYRGQETKTYKSLRDSEKDRFIQLLDAGRDVEMYTSLQDSARYYHMVFYTDGPLAYSFTILDDGSQVCFYPMGTRLVDSAIRPLLQP